MEVRALIILFALSTAYGQAPKDAQGAVCTGRYVPIIIQENEMERVYFTVGDSQKIFFDHPGTVVLNNLELHKSYRVRVFYDNEQVEAWNLRFDRLKVHMVTIWRSAGHWHMDPNPSGKCRK